MTPLERQVPIRFTRGRRMYVITRAYAGGEGYVGLCDGRMVTRDETPSQVARTLIAGPLARQLDSHLLELPPV